ncbi:MAG: hypothetical protein ACE5G2_09225 [Candidatus Krumholzibacteriia bacterium]
MSAQAVRPAAEPSPELLERYLKTREWVVVGDAPVRAYATRSWRRQAELAEAAARHSLPRIASELGVAPRQVLPVWIVVSPGGGRFVLEAPSWSAAIARPRRHLVVLSGPALRRTRMNLQETVAHELVHLAVHERIGDFGWMPLWLHEGLAVHFSGYGRLRDRLVRWGRGPVRLQELEYVFPRNATRARQAYLESAAAVRRLLQEGPIAPLLDRIEAGEEYEEAFLAVYAMTSREFAALVYEEVAQRWRYLSLLTSGVTLFGLMTILFVVGGVRRRLRDRRRMREWEAEEAAIEPVQPPSPAVPRRGDRTSKEHADRPPQGRGDGPAGQ